MKPMLLFSALLLSVTLCPAASHGGDTVETVRPQKDQVGFAVSWEDMQQVASEALQKEGLPPLDASGFVAHAPDGPVWTAAIMPHDDYVYAGPTAVHLLGGMVAPRWIVFGVCHACRRIGVRDRLIFDDYERWKVAGVEFPVDTELRQQILDRLDSSTAFVDRERHRQEHSVEALLPWTRLAVGDFQFVPILVPGMEFSRMDSLSTRLATIVAQICSEHGWTLGRDLGILISADAVHYGCEGWGGRGYDPFGCDGEGHAAAIAQDRTLAEATLCGPLTRWGPASFARLVWDDEHPEYPYRITWCGLYSIPFGLLTTDALRRSLELPPLTGTLVRYGDSVSDGRLKADGTQLGVTAPNTLQHWVGYASVAYAPGP